MQKLTAMQQKMSMTILPMLSAPRATRPLSGRSGRPWG